MYFGERQSAPTPTDCESGVRATSGPRDLMPALLLSLAPELIQVITEDLDIPTVKQLRLTCKTLGAFLKPHIFRVLRLKVAKNSVLRDVDRLRILAGVTGTAKAPEKTGPTVLEQCPASYSTRTLYIGPLTPSHDPPYLRSVVIHTVDGNEECTIKREDDTSDVALAEEALRLHLFDAITSLKGVISVEWTPTRNESVETQYMVMKALKMLPNLLSVRFSLRQCKIGLPLDTLTSLRDISLSGTCEKDHDVTLASLARLVATTPSLTSIDITTNWVHHQPIGRMQSLHALFEHYPRRAAPLSLRRLALTAALVRFDEVTLPHLRCLTALSLTSIEDPYTRGRYVVEDLANGLGSGSALMGEQKQYGSALEEVWRALKAAEIWLEELTVDVVVPGLLEYFKAYSGLRKLVFIPKGPCFAERWRSDALADDLYAAVLRRHASSLRELEVDAMYEGKWCLGHHNLDLIASCRSLKSMKMSIISKHLNPQGIPSKGIDCIKLLLDAAVLSMHQLDDIQVDATDRAELHDAFYGASPWLHFSTTRMLIAESFSTYRAPVSCHRLPAKVTVGKHPCAQRFVVHRVVSDRDGEGNDELDEGLRYICINHFEN